MPGFLVHSPPVKLCVGIACVLSFWNTVSAMKGDAKKEKVMTFLPTIDSDRGGEERKDNGVHFLDTTELPAKSVDLSELNLTELVNGMLSRALRESKKFFSLLSITSYSSFAFHKFSVAIYNISNLKTVDPAKFPTRYCYCLNNRTNDLSDFTALLVDIIGNSTSFLTEIFKSTSILSVSQTNDSDCLFICVMTGKSGRNLSDFWELAEQSPVLNYTFTSSLPGVLATRRMPVTAKLTATSQGPLPRTSPPRQARSTGVSALSTAPWTELTRLSAGGEQTVNADRPPELLTGTAATPPAVATSRVAGTPWVTATRPVPWAQTSTEKTPGGLPGGTQASVSTSPAETRGAVATRGPPGPPARTMATHSSPSESNPVSGTFTPGTQTPSPTKAPAPKYLQPGDLPAAWPFNPVEEPALVPGPQVQVSRCPPRLPQEGSMAAAPLLLAIQKHNICLMELCRFFQQCLCLSQGRDPRMAATRYCLEYYSWFLKNATFICQRVTRVSHSHTLKQRCLENVCKSV